MFLVWIFFILSSPHPLVSFHLETKGLKLNPSFHLCGLISLDNEVMGLVDEGRAVGIIYLDFSKAFEDRLSASS